MEMSSDGSFPLYVTVVAIIVLALINGFTSAAKRSLDHLDRNAIKEKLEEDEENKKLNLILSFIDKPSKYHYADIGVCNLALIGSMWLFTLALFSSVSVWWHRLIWELVFFLVYLALADLLPKKLAAQNTENYARALVGYQRVLYYVTLPLVKLTVAVTNFFLVIMRKKTDVDDAYFSEARIMSMLDKGQESGEIKEEGRKMIDSIFQFDDLLAYEIMTPRTDVFMIDLQDDKDEYFDQLMELRYSRIPICDNDADNIVGILHIKDYLLKGGLEGFDNVDIRDIMREPYLVPETKNIDSLFVELQRTKQHIAILIDEYGGFSGIVSVEDIIEQIVGDIDDEFDQEERIITKVDDDTYIVDGDVYLDDLDEETGIQLESENNETIGGFLIELMGEIPKECRKYPAVRYEQYLFEILHVRDRRIDSLKITIDRDYQPEDPEKKEKKEKKEK